MHHADVRFGLLEPVGVDSKALGVGFGLQLGGFCHARMLQAQRHDDVSAGPRFFGRRHGPAAKRLDQKAQAQALGGPVTTISAPGPAKAASLERATRAGAIYPTMAMRQPLREPACRVSV